MGGGVSRQDTSSNQQHSCNYVSQEMDLHVNIFLLGNKFYTHKFFALFTVGSVHFSVYNS